MSPVSFSSADDPTPSPHGFAGTVMAARHHVDVTIPRTKIAGKMRVLSKRERTEVRHEAREALKELGLVSLPLESHREWHEEIATRTLAVAVRSPNDISQPLASIEAWNQCDEGQIDALWQRYKDLQDQLDPLENPSLSEEAMRMIQDAAKKKQMTLLMSFGSCVLASYVITTAAQPST